MNRLIATLLFATVGTAIVAQAGANEDNYQLLRKDPAGFATVTPGYAFEFPSDHLAHPAFRIEWWYMTGNLTDEQGREFGIQWTLFRQSLTPETDRDQGWQSNQVWMAHAAVATPSGFYHQERFARGGIGQAGVSLDDGQFVAWLDDWALTGAGDAPLPGHLEFRLNLTETPVEVSLDLDAGTPLVMHGDNGYSQKSALGQASYYYSQPLIDAVGTVTIGSETFRVHGRSWLDREWSSQPLAPSQPGWDWLSAHLDDGSAVMVYRLRNDNGNHSVNGTFIHADGSASKIPSDAIRFDPLNETSVTTDGGTRNLPLDWQLSLTDRDLKWTIRARSPDHWLDTSFPYWEGPVTLDGEIPGRGYLELTGYPAGNRR